MVRESERVPSAALKDSLQLFPGRVVAAGATGPGQPEVPGRGLQRPLRGHGQHWPPDSAVTSHTGHCPHSGSPSSASSFIGTQSHRRGRLPVWPALTPGPLRDGLIAGSPRPHPDHITVTGSPTGPRLPHNLRPSYPGGHSKNVEVPSQEPGKQASLSTRSVLGCPAVEG